AKKAVLDATAATAEETPHVVASFIHFESKGYPGPDARMQEYACLTGGHYIFLNFNQIAEPVATRKEAIEDAAAKIRYTFGGYWSLVTEVGSFTGAPGASAANVKSGFEYTLTGSMAFDGTVLSPSTVSRSFSVDKDSWDRRLYLRKACTND